MVFERGHARHTVGREDRLVRGCVAFSLVLLAGFVVIATGGVALSSFAFLLLGGYFAITAVTGWDPVYDRMDIDTRSHDELAEATGVPHESRTTMDVASVLGLRHDGPVPNDQPS